MIPVICCFDKNMILPAKVCLFSLFENAKDKTNYDIFIICKVGEIPPEEKDSFNVLLKQYPQHRISFIEIKDFFKGAYEIRNITTTCYYRLLIPQLQKQINSINQTNYNVIIYLDVDTIIECDLSMLYNTSLKKEEWIGGICETPLYNQSNTDYLIKIGCNPSEYINSGVLIMDINKLNETDFHKNVLNISKKQYICQDQDIINIVCKGHIKQLPLKYNYTTILYRLSISNQNFRKLKENEISDTKDSIIHYTGEKPWNGYCLRSYIWWYYFMKSPYANRETDLKNFLLVQSQFINNAPIRNLIQEISFRIKNKIRKV